MPRGIDVRAVLRAAREVRGSLPTARPVQVSGALADILAKELGRGAGPGAVRVGGRIEEAAVLVRVLAGPVSEEDEGELAAAHRARVPIVAVQTGHGDGVDVPYALATAVVACPPGAGFPLDRIAQALAAGLESGAAAVAAARVPVLRPAVCHDLIRKAALQNGVLGAAVFVPGADLPVLALNQLRLVLRLAAAHGRELDRERAPEAVAVLGGAYGFRALARQLLGLVPVAGWAVKGAVAYGGTRAVGEAALRFYAED
jgi:uncharacterized protein (DUF697 family)